MKVREVFNSHFARLCKAEAVTLYPFIFYAHDEESERNWFVIAHEHHHVEQIRKLGWFRFYWRYLCEYIKNRRAGMSPMLAYMSISFEQEAREVEHAARIAHYTSVITTTPQGNE